MSGSFAGPQELARFRREAEALAGLRHPNIVQVYDAGDVEGHPYFTMEFMEGGSLARRLAATTQPPKAPLNRSRFLRVAWNSRIAAGLSTAN